MNSMRVNDLINFMYCDRCRRSGEDVQVDECWGLFEGPMQVLCVEPGRVVIAENEHQPSHGWEQLAKEVKDGYWMYTEICAIEYVIFTWWPDEQSALAAYRDRVEDDSLDRSCLFHSEKGILRSQEHTTTKLGSDDMFCVEMMKRFIDSKEIREYNWDTEFSPLEQAVLIYYSRNTTMEQKLAAWKKLLETYTEEEFAGESELAWTRKKCRDSGERYWDRCDTPKEAWSNKKILQCGVEAYEKALEERYYFASVVYETNIYYEESGLCADECGRKPEQAYFSDYDSALAYLQEVKQESEEADEFLGVLEEASIKTVKLNEGNTYGGDVFWFDRDLRLITVENEEADSCMRRFFAYIPLPFKKGDILRSTGCGETVYGVLTHDVDKESFRPAIERGEGVDMSLGLVIFHKEQGKWVFDYDSCHMNYLWLEKCPDDELPEAYSILILLSAVYKGELPLDTFLALYSQFGEKAYRRGGESYLYARNADGI